MRARTTRILSIGALLLLSSQVHAKGAEGLVLLKGAIQAASISADTVSFSFTGQLSFSFFNATRGDPARERIDLKFDVRELSVQIPKFGKGSDDKSDDPFVVSFDNAAKHAAEASKTGELVTVVLFSPALSYAIDGVIEKAACTHAQVMPERIDHQLHGSLAQ